jgi:hypothetical protein
MCEAVLNLRMTRWTRPRQTGLLRIGTCGTKPRPALPNRHARSALFWYIMKHIVVIPYQHFRTTYRSHLQESINPKEHDQSSLKQSSFLGLCTLPNFLTSIMFQKLALFPFSGREAPNLMDPLTELFLLTWCYRSSNLSKYAPENKSGPGVITRN